MQDHFWPMTECIYSSQWESTVVQFEVGSFLWRSVNLFFGDFLSILEVNIQSFNWLNRRDDECTKGGGEERWSAGRRRRSNDPAEIPEGTISRKSRHKDALKLIMNMIIVVEIQWFSIIELWIVILRFQFNKTHNVVLELRALRGTT